MALTNTPTLPLKIADELLSQPLRTTAAPPSYEDEADKAEFEVNFPRFFQEAAAKIAEAERVRQAQQQEFAARQAVAETNPGGELDTYIGPAQAQQAAAQQAAKFQAQQEELAAQQALRPQASQMAPSIINEATGGLFGKLGTVAEAITSPVGEAIEAGIEGTGAGLEALGADTVGTAVGSLPEAASEFKRTFGEEFQKKTGQPLNLETSLSAINQYGAKPLAGAGGQAIDYATDRSIDPLLRTLLPDAVADPVISAIDVAGYMAPYVALTMLAPQFGVPLDVAFALSATDDIKNLYSAYREGMIDGRTFLLGSGMASLDLIGPVAGHLIGRSYRGWRNAKEVEDAVGRINEITGKVDEGPVEEFIPQANDAIRRADERRARQRLGTLQEEMGRREDVGGADEFLTEPGAAQAGPTAPIVREAEDIVQSAEDRARLIEEQKAITRESMKPGRRGLNEAEAVSRETQEALRNVKPPEPPTPPSVRRRVERRVPPGERGSVRLPGEGPEKTAKAFLDRFEKKYPNGRVGKAEVKLQRSDISGQEDAVLLDWITTAGAMGKGHGTKALDDILDLADETGTPVVLQPEARPGGRFDEPLDDEALTDFYSRHGFEFVGDDVMRYEPGTARTPSPAGATEVRRLDSEIRRLEEEAENLEQVGGDEAGAELDVIDKEIADLRARQAELEAATKPKFEIGNLSAQQRDIIQGRLIEQHGDGRITVSGAKATFANKQQIISDLESQLDIFADQRQYARDYGGKFENAAAERATRSLLEKVRNAGEPGAVKAPTPKLTTEDIPGPSNAEVRDLTASVGKSVKAPPSQRTKSLNRALDQENAVRVAAVRSLETGEIPAKATDEVTRAANEIQGNFRARIANLPDKALSNASENMTGWKKTEVDALIESRARLAEQAKAAAPSKEAQALGYSTVPDVRVDTASEIATTQLDRVETPSQMASWIRQNIGDPTPFLGKDSPYWRPRSATDSRRVLDMGALRNDLRARVPGNSTRRAADTLGLKPTDPLGQCGMELL